MTDNEPTAPEPSGSIRDVVKLMLDSAEFYAGLVTNIQHHPNCWKSHTACALRRVLDAFDDDDEEDSW